MALETLKGVDKIGGFEITFDKEHDRERHVLVDHQSNTIAFKIQDGPIKEHGVNGCQVDTLIHAAKKILEGLNEKFPCSQNHNAMAGLSVALASLEQRKEERESRDVEGTSNV